MARPNTAVLRMAEDLLLLSRICTVTERRALIVGPGATVVKHAEVGPDIFVLAKESTDSMPEQHKP